MKPVEKVLCGFTLFILLAGCFCYVGNDALYQEVDNRNPVSGYTQFVEKLSDETFVRQHYEDWENARSWVLRDLYHFLVTKEARLHTVSFVATQAVITFAYYFCIASIPFLVLTGIRVYQRKREKGKKEDEKCCRQ